MKEFIQTLADEVVNGSSISFEEARSILTVDDSNLSLLLTAANRIREYFRGEKVKLCSITNAKSGACTQNCKFCAQSASSKTNVAAFPLIKPKEMLEKASIAYQNKARRFCFVTSGAGLNNSEIDIICEGLRLIRKSFSDLKLDVSLGFLTRERAQRLKQAGVSRYNHNLETSAEYFTKICTTHTYSERLNTVLIAKEAGLEVCCGGIFGLGESDEDRLRLGFKLKELDVDCIPINFLNPVSGTALENQQKLSSEECLKTIAVFRFIHPKKEIKVCGGREVVLGDKQGQIFRAGADSIILGDYLTTKGNAASDDIDMIRAEGLYV